MHTLNYLLLSVADPGLSAQLYQELLGVTPVESSPTFVLFVLPNGIKIGLWSASEIEPHPRAAGGIEVSFSEKSREAVLATCAAWEKLGVKIVQQPTEMDFGFTFVAEDLDGHRLRPFVLASKPR